MRTPAVLALATFLISGAAFAADPRFGEGNAPPEIPYEGGSGREVCLSEPPTLDRAYGSSEIIGMFGLESRLANDFVLTEPSELTLIRWWGVIYQYAQGDPTEFVTCNLQVLSDEGGVPNYVLFEAFCVDSHPVLIHELPHDLFYEYWTEVESPCFPEGTYWLMAQCCDHVYPPQWGRLAAMEVTGHESMFWSPYFGFDDWTPTTDVWGFAWDAAQEFECVPCEPTAAVPSTWGAIRALFR